MKHVFLVIGCAALVATSVPVVAVAEQPAATTEPASAVTATTPMLNATLFATKEDTTYPIQHGTTSEYGAQTAAAGLIVGSAGKRVSADIASAGGGAAPRGSSAPVPDTVTVAATPLTVMFGKPVTVSGQLTGSNSIATTLNLEQTPFSFTRPFKPAGTTITDASGRYSIQTTPQVTTKYRVTARTSRPTTSPEVSVSVRPAVGLRLSDRTPRRGQRVRFSGSVLPAHDGKLVRIERRTTSGWRTIATPTLQSSTPVSGVARSRYTKRIRIRGSGDYRSVFIPADGDHVRGTSAKRRVRTH